MASEPREATRDRMASVPFHPLLFAIAPILYLAAQNIADVQLSEVALPVLVALAVAAVLFVVARAIVRDRLRAALIVTTLLLSFLLFGHVENLVAPVRISQTRLLFVWIALTAVAVVSLLVTRRRLTGVTLLANVVSVVLVGFSVATIASHELTVASHGFAVPAASAAPTPTQAVGGQPAPAAGTLRDIYYIVVEDYGSERTGAHLGLDNRGFFEHLTGRGFDVLTDTRTNYGRSALSLASSLNMTYLDEVAAQYGPEWSDYGGINKMVRDPIVGQYLQSKGYTFVQIGSQYYLTAVSDIADVNPRYRQTSDFLAALYDMTILSPIASKLGVDSPLDTRRRNYDAALWQWDQFEQATKLSGPTFVFLHVFLPHQPYVVDERGNYVSRRRDATRSPSERRAQQWAYVNSQLQQLIDPLVAGPADKQPIIIVTTDEGTTDSRTPQKFGNENWAAASTSQLDEHYAIFAAYFLPGIVDKGPYPTMSSVNTFRLVFNDYFNAGLALLPDRYFVHRDVRHPYDLTEITDRLNAARAEERKKLGLPTP